MRFQFLPFLLGSLFAVILAMLAGIVGPSMLTAAEDRPNIVLVMADDQGWGDMAYNGHPKLKTPQFDKAAAECLRFDRFYAAAPVCSPTRASVMTGRHPNRMGVFKWGYPMRPQETTIAEALKSAGYATAHFGKWHLGSVRNASPAHPGANGFDEWLSAPNFYDNDPVLSHKGKAVQTEGESSIVAVDAAIQWMSKQSAGQTPFLAVVWFGSPHSPHRAVEQDRKHYANESPNLQNFYGEITGMDRAFGKIREAIKSRTDAANTILWYCSDNGALPKVGNTGGHRGNKGKVYEGGLLVPAFIEWPAVIKSPSRSAMRCNTCDIYPTLLDVCGVKVEGQTPLDGISLKPLLRGDSATRDEGMGFWDYPISGIGTPSAKWMGDLLKAQQEGGDLAPHPSSQNAAKLPTPRFTTDKMPGHAAWISGDWKLHRIVGGNGKTTIELYNLADDPNETKDLAEVEAKRAKKLADQLQTWMTSVVGSLNGDDYAKVD